MAITGETEPATGAEPGAPRLAARVAVVGISIDQPCGVRDHAELLAAALAENGVQCTRHWLARSGSSLAAERRQVRQWTAALAERLERDRPNAVLLHYSVFAFAHRGLPVFVRPALAGATIERAPLVCFMHELAYPWRMGGARGALWAATQRAALFAVMRRSHAVIVSSDARAEWLRGRPWLARRPTSVAPVFSNLPTPAHLVRPAEQRLGLFGYGHEGVALETVLDALRLVRDGHDEAELVLLGAPGRSSAAGERWVAAAEERGLGAALRFSGRLPAQELSDELARCAALLFAERGGPTSRKTTLAASLASGRPVVALDGRNSWAALSRAQGAVLVEPHARALAGALRVLLEDRAASERQGARGRAFAARAMSVTHSANVVTEALRGAIEQAAS